MGGQNVMFSGGNTRFQEGSVCAGTQKINLGFSMGDQNVNIPKGK